jgi:uncharacterized membrane protein YfcA
MSDVARTYSIGRVVAIGVGAGLLSGMFGVGGGILVVPALVLMLRFDQRLANGTSLGAVLPISVASLFTYWSHDNVDWSMALWLVVGALAGAVLGTKWIHVLPRKVLGYLFAAMLLVTAIRLFVPMTAHGRDDITVITAIALVFIGLATGTLAGLLGIGGGVVMVPAMIVFFDELNVVAKGTSVAVIIPTSIMGTWRNWKADNIDLRVAAIVGFGGIASAVAGGVIADRMSDDLSNVLFATLVMIVAARMIRDLRRDTA